MGKRILVTTFDREDDLLRGAEAARAEGCKAMAVQRPAAAVQSRTTSPSTWTGFSSPGRVSSTTSEVPHGRGRLPPRSKAMPVRDTLIAWPWNARVGVAQRTSMLTGARCTQRRSAISGIATRRVRRAPGTTTDTFR